MIKTDNKKRGNQMTCPKCSTKMFRTSLNYESNGLDNFSVLGDTLFYKCPICGHHHFLRTETNKKVFINGQKIKGIPVDVG